MADPTRPLPNLHDLDTQAFWLATKEKRLIYQQCADCGAVVFYPRRRCSSCLSANLEWKESAGEGMVYTYSIVRQSYHPFFRSMAPYAVAWVDLDEGPRLVSNVVGLEDPSGVRIGMRVKVRWEEHEGLCVPLFEPA